MKDVTGIILAQDRCDAMRELTNDRTVASVPFGGRYRLIDFALSNLVNAGVRDVGVVTKSNYYSLMDHVGSGKEWDLNRKKGGLSILPPSVGTMPGGFQPNAGKIEALHGIINYIRNCGSKYIIVTDANIVANIDFNEMLEYHIEKHAYMTVLYQKDVFEQNRFRDNTFLQINNDGRITDVAINQTIQLHSNMLLGTFIIERELLDFLISQCAAHNRLSFERDIIQDMCNDLDIYAYSYEGYVEKIDSVDTFRKTNMDLLDPSVRNELFRNGAILTKVRDEVPTYYGERSYVENSLIADGCIIKGRVENSVIFRSVIVEENAVVKNSIIMQDGKILRGALVEHCITDKMVTVGENKTIVGAESYPVVLAKNAEI